MSLPARKRRILPKFSATANQRTEHRARAAMMISPYKNGQRLPKTFKQMCESFKQDGVSDAEATRKATAFIKSQRKIRNQATLYFDEIWSGLHGVANECKKGASDLEEARKRYNQFAETMAVVIKPLIDDNQDDLTEHDYGAPLSGAGAGCVEAAWAGKTPYD